jgi:hypothetical protein
MRKAVTLPFPSECVPTYPTRTIFLHLDLNVSPVHYCVICNEI